MKVLLLVEHAAALIGCGVLLYTLAGCLIGDALRIPARHTTD